MQVSAANWPVLERWDVPWEWQTVLLSTVACGVRYLAHIFKLTG